MNNLEDEILFSDYELGLDAIEFLNSRMGQALQKEAQHCIDEALEVLLNLEADTKTIREAQQKALIARSAIQWLLGFVKRGKLAAENAKALDAEEMP